MQPLPPRSVSARLFWCAATAIKELQFWKSNGLGDNRWAETSTGGVIHWRGFHWWPLAGASLHKAVPPQIGSAFSEAFTALEAGCPRASAAMARRTLEAIAVDKGETQGTLDHRLRNLAATGVLHPSLADWTKEVRLVGNSGAHFDPMDDVSLDDARQLVDFVRELLKFLYVLPYELQERPQPPAPPPRRE